MRNTLIVATIGLLILTVFDASGKAPAKKRKPPAPAEKSDQDSKPSQPGQPTESKKWHCAYAGGLIDGRCVGVDDQDMAVIESHDGHRMPVPLELFDAGERKELRQRFHKKAPAGEKDTDGKGHNGLPWHTTAGGVAVMGKAIERQDDLVIIEGDKGKRYRMPFELLAQGARGRVPPAVPKAAGTQGPAAKPAAGQTAQDKIVVPLPHPYDEFCAGGGGRYLIFRHKEAKCLSVFDVVQGRVVHTINIPADEFVFAAGTDKLMVALPGQKIIQRWSLKSFEREKTCPAPADLDVRKLVMGYSSQGPLMLWSAAEGMLFDIERMQPLAVRGEMLHGSPKWGLNLTVSADGQTFLGWVDTGSGATYRLLRVVGDRTGVLTGPGGIYGQHEAQPNPDAGLVLCNNGTVFNAILKPLPTEWLKGWKLIPTEDPRFFVALRGSGGTSAEVAICTAADRQPVYTMNRLPEMTAPRGGDPLGGVANPRVRYIPRAKLLVTLPPSNDEVVVRKLDLLEEVKKAGKDYLFVTSMPPTLADPRTPYVYQIEAASKAGGVKYKLESGPQGMTVSATGELRWRAAAPQVGSMVNVIVAASDASGKETFHTFDIAVVAAGAARLAPQIASAVERTAETASATPTRPSPRTPTRPAPHVRPPSARGPTQPAAGASSADAAATGEFKVLPTEWVPTSMELSEDGQLLFVSHEKDNKVTVWQVKSAESISTITTPAPRAMLSRGKTLYVGNYGKGTISAYSQDKKWELTDQVEVGHPLVVHLSAPRGEFFRGVVLVNCGKYRENKGFVVDVAKDKHRPVLTLVVDQVDAQGRYAIGSDEFNMSPGGTIHPGDYQELVAGRRLEIGQEGGAYLVPGFHGKYWFGGRSVYAGMPPRPIGPAQSPPVEHGQQEFVIPDHSGTMFYMIGQKKLRAFLLRPGLPEVGSVPAVLPAPYANDNLYGDPRGYRFASPFAITAGKNVYIYVLEAHSNKIFYRDFPAFPTESVAGTGQPDGQPGDAAQPAAAEAIRVVEGQPLSHALATAGDARSFSLMSGPEGLTLSAAGKITWTPGREVIGSHQVKVKITGDGKTAIQRYTIEVVDRQLAAAAGGDLAKADAGTSLELTQEQCQIQWNTDRSAVLLLQGRVLDVLTPDGNKISKSLLLPRYCFKIFERPDHYVGWGNMEVHIIDRSTLQLTKTISLAQYRRIHDMAPHPAGKWIYVSVEKSLSDEEPGEKQQVLAVDEASGEVTEIAQAYGRFLAVDPEGKYLFAGYKDLFQTGENYHMNPGGQVITIPEYGNIDMLLRYAIRGRSLKLEETFRKAGGNGQSIVLAPDGRQICYLSFVGCPEFSRNIAAFGAGDLSKPQLSYLTKDRADCKTLVYHPVLDLAASPGSGSAVLFDSRTGEPLPDKLRLTAQGLGKAQVQRLCFSADGQHLLFALSEPNRIPYLRSVPLRLSAAELGKLAAAPAGRPAPPATGAETRDTTPFQPAGKSLSRTWTDASGKFKTEAEFQGLDGDKVRLRRRDGTTIAIPLEKLSDDDQAYLRQQKKALE